VSIIAATVIAGRPPICFEISIPIGVVTDLGSRDLIMASLSPKSLERTRIHEIPAIQPVIIPTKIGRA
jgi:hypothetical protein